MSSPADHKSPAASSDADLRKQLAQLTREWETLQTAIPAAQAAELLMAAMAAKPDPMLDHSPNPFITPESTCHCAN